MMSVRAAAITMLCLGCFAARAAAQTPSIRVYSEFLRVDPFGKIIPPDQARRPEVRPREILSPAVARGAYSRFRAAITLPPGASYTLYVAQNPDDVFRFKLYREIHAYRDGRWIPDALEPVEIPARGALGSSNPVIPAQTTFTYLLEMFTPSDRPPFRARVELQVYDGSDWYIYPMEVRIVSATVPRHPDMRITLPPPNEPSDAVARAALRAYLCGAAPASAAPATDTIRGLILRSIAQDLALARTLETKPGERLLPEILRLTGKGDAAGWCSNPVFPADLGPEWYLRLRDAVLRWSE